MPIFNDKGEQITVTEAGIVTNGAKGQEAAAPAAEETGGKGENAQEVAAPAAEPKNGTEKEKNTHTESPDDPPEVSSADNEIGPSANDEGEDEKTRNARFAAERRKKEAEAALEKAKSEAKAAAESEFSEFIKSLGLKDDAGKPVSSIAEYNAIKEKVEKSKVEGDLKKAGLNPETLEQIIANHPDVVAAKKQAAEFAQAAKKALDAQRQTVIASAMDKIKALDPTIKTTADLVISPRYDEVKKYFELGLPLEKAYKLVHEEEIEARKIAAEAQRQKNNLSGKDHLKQNATNRAGEGFVITDEQFSLIKQAMPDITREEAAKYYKKYGP